MAAAYVIILGLVFYLSFLGGAWKGMRVIEVAAPAPPQVYGESPVVTADPSGHVR